ncbi:MAG: FAD-dependent monooxygenase [Deltaproteobacteria bacterium]
MMDRADPASTPPQPLILIAGAGIAGLAAAIALARTGRAVTVFEKRRDASEEGAGIQIGPNGTRILHELGVAPHLLGTVATPESIRVMDGLSGRELTRLPLGQDIARRHGAPYWVVHRADLHAALRQTAASLPSITLRLGAEVKDATTAAGSVTARLADGEEMRGSALLAADGLWSKLRANVMGSPGLVFTGKCAFRTVLPASGLPAGISQRDTTIWLRPAAHVVHYPVRAGRELAVVAIFDDRELGETWAGDVPAQTIASRAAAFPQPLRDLLLQTAAWRQWSLYRPSAPTRWIQDRIALIGDAAHPPLPFLAQGGVMALEDAVVLAALLDGAPAHEIPGRLAAYERVRRPRTTEVMEASARNGQAYHLDGVIRSARNALLSAMPPRLLMRQYDWLYGWTPETALRNARIPAGTAPAR